MYLNPGVTNWLHWYVKYPYSPSLFPTIELKHQYSHYYDICCYTVDTIVQSGMLDHYWKMMESRVNLTLIICIILTGNPIICYLTVWCLIDIIYLYDMIRHIQQFTHWSVFSKERAQLKIAFKLCRVLGRRWLVGEI